MTNAQVDPREPRSGLRASALTLADFAAIGVVAALPWSTTATGVCVMLWALLLAVALRPSDYREAIWTPFCALPVLLWLLGVAGMAWADVSWAERLKGLSGFNKLLVIPLAYAHFRLSPNGHRVIAAFLASCSLLLAASWAHYFAFGTLVRFGKIAGVPVKDWITQAQVFEICIFGLAFAAMEAWRKGRRGLSVMAGMLAVFFLANITYVSVSRSALVVLPFLFVFFIARLFGRRALIVAVAGAVLIGALVWASSPHLRARMAILVDDISRYPANSDVTSAGQRLDWWRKSLRIIPQAPVIGNGTGSMANLLSRDYGDIAASPGATNPHNQVFAVGIQLGAAGVVILIAMWLTHLLCFRRSGLLPWFGFVVVFQNIVSSLFNSHLFDFTAGGVYVMGVGLLGGATARLFKR